MKNIIVILCFVIIRSTVCYACENPETSVKISIEEDIVIALVWPEVCEAVSNYYSEYISGDVHVAQYYGTKLISLGYNKQASKTGTFKYCIAVEVEPYIGAHNSIGKDIVVIGVDNSGAEVCDFQHLESFEIDHPFLKKRIIKPFNIQIYYSS